MVAATYLERCFSVLRTIVFLNAHIPASSELESCNVKTFVVNPKSLDGAELYGGFSATTREWTDGIFSALLRTCCADVQHHSTSRRWIVLDGPVDVTWVESMNSLLDDNKTLTLTNGDRIELHSQVGMAYVVPTPPTENVCLLRCILPLIFSEYFAACV